MHPPMCPGPRGRGAAQRREPYTCSNRAYGGAATGVVVLPGAVPERARMGTGPDHCVMGAVRLRGGAGRVRGRRGRAHGGVLQRGAGLPVGVVPAAACARRRGWA
jgi:hypothetical protein